MQRRSLPLVFRSQATKNGFLGSLLTGFSPREGSVGKQIATIVLLALGLIMSGCGSGSASAASASRSINGAWTATLTNANGSIAYQFSATFTQDLGGVLSITNLTFTDPGACLLSDQPGAQGSFAPANEAFGMSMISPDVGGPMLSLQGTLSNGRISGSWSASGLLPPCNGTGTFTIQPST